MPAKFQHANMSFCGAVDVQTVRWCAFLTQHQNKPKIFCVIEFVNWSMLAKFQHANTLHCGAIDVRRFGFVHVQNLVANTPKMSKLQTLHA
jgi:hypothetical protein